MTNRDEPLDPEESPYNKGLSLFRSGAIREAFPYLLEAAGSEPDNKEAAFLLGVCSFRMKEFERAEDLFRSVIALDNQHYRAHYYLGLSLERQGRTKDAITQYKFTLIIKPGFREAEAKIHQFGNTPVLTSVDNGGEALAAQVDGIKQPRPPGEQELGPGALLYTVNRRRTSFFRYVISTLMILALCFVAVILVQKSGRPPNDTDELGHLLLVIAAVIFLFVLADMVLRPRYTTLSVYESRLDLASGILFRKQRSIWLYEIVGVSFSRGPWLFLTNSGQINVETGGGVTPRSTDKLVGYGNKKFMELLWHEIRDAVLVERRSMKRFFI